MKKTVYITGETPPRFNEAFQELCEDLAIEISEEGVQVALQKGKALSLHTTGNRIHVTWAQPVQLYRALSLLGQATNIEALNISELPCFETLAIMFDSSRNAVLTVKSMQMFLRKMALMGFNLAMMYTEDTYEVPGRPYFGYMRGRYSQQEMRALDDYADLFGIEMCPCIQTLGHLNRALHWPALSHLADNAEVIMADDEDTYAFLEQIIAAAAMPYRSKRIHIGMDEAHGVGLGAHLRKFGYENPHSIIHRHLIRVKSIVDKLGLNAMMWSDMYFRPDSPTNGYYDSGVPRQELVDSAPHDISLIYWDYYHNRTQEYTAMLDKHKGFAAPLGFAGAIWTFAGPCPDYDKTIRATIPALGACKKANIPLVIATAWGDNGAETNMLTALPGMQLFAEYCYTGKYDNKELAERFEACCHANINEFLELSEFNTVPGMRSGELRPVNAAKILLYQDPLVQLFADDMKGLLPSVHYKGLAARYAEYAKDNSEYKQLMLFYHLLAQALWRKSEWHEQAAQCVQSGDQNLAKRLAQEVEQTVDAIETLRIEWGNLWTSTNKPYGFEIIDLRLGGIRARLLTAQKRILLFAQDKNETLPELLEQTLPYKICADGTNFGSYAISEIVSACKIDM